MKQDYKYFISYPNVFLLLALLILIGAIAVLASSMITRIVCLFLMMIILGLEPKLIGYHSRIEFKYLGVLFFRNKELNFNNVNEVHIKYHSVRNSVYICRCKLKNNKKDITFRIRKMENMIVLLHLLTEHNIKVFTQKDDHATKHVYQIMEDERKVESFNLYLRKYDEPDMFTDVWLACVILIYIIYLFR